MCAGGYIEVSFSKASIEIRLILNETLNLGDWGPSFDCDGPSARKTKRKERWERIRRERKGGGGSKGESRYHPSQNMRIEEGNKLPTCIETAGKDRAWQSERLRKNASKITIFDDVL